MNKTMPESSSSYKANSSDIKASSLATKNQQYQALFDSIPQSGLKCDVLFVVIRNRIQEEQEYVKRLRVVFQFNILKNQQHVATWTCDTKTTLEGDIYRSAPKEGLKADCILTVDDDDWVKIMVGKLNPQRAFMMSKFKIKGNIMLLQKLHSIWHEMRKAGKTPELDLIQEIMVNEPLLPGLKSEAMAIEIVQRLVKWPHLVASLDANLQLNVTKNGIMMTKYLIGMKPNKKPQFRRLYNGLLSLDDTNNNNNNNNKPPKQQGQRTDKNEEDTSHNYDIKADLIFTVEDDDLVLIIYGIYKVSTAISSGRLQVEGKQELLEKASALFEQSPIMSKL